MHMNESNAASHYLVTLARESVQVYVGQLSAKAIILAGSAAEGLSDHTSDLDIIIYYDVLPAEERLVEASQHNQGEERRLLGPRNHESCIEIYRVHGIECQIVHTTVVEWEQQMAIVLEQLDVTSPIQKALAGMLHALSLHGQSVIEHWQQCLTAYPDTLAEAMVRHYLAFTPPWALYENLKTRDATIWWYQMMVDTAYHLLGVLAGLNRCYYSTFQFKRMRRFIAEMKITPTNFAERLESLFHVDPASQSLLTKELTGETVALIEERMPQIDTSTVKRLLAWQSRLWEAV